MSYVDQGLLEFLTYIKDRGYEPKTVLDIGANIGSWTENALSIYPDARYICFDPLTSPLLEDFLKANPKVEFRQVLLGAKYERKTFYDLATETENGAGSSVYPENTNFPRVAKPMVAHRLDSMMHTINESETPLILKLDVQGSELDVLRGAQNTLQKVDLLIAELSTLEYNQGAPLFTEVIAYLADKGFILFDLFGAFRRLDGALFQTNAAFVRANHWLREPKPFW